MVLNKDTIWYVVACNNSKMREENYPLSIYADKALAEAVAQANNEKVVLVKPILYEKD
jgi:hypothetical protein